MTRSPLRLPALLTLAGVLLAACGGGGDDPRGGAPTTTAGRRNAVTVYSGRTESLIAPLLAQFTRDTGIQVSPRYGESAELAAQIVEEGRRSPADVFLSQDAGALGAVAKRNLFAPAPSQAASAVDKRFRAADGTWVGVSGRARVVVYNSQKVGAADLPSSVFALTDRKWRGRIGIAPTNASFQAFVTAMRVQVGESRTREWLQGLEGNEPRIYERNGLIVRAVNDGEVDLGLVNHYYLYELGKEIGHDKLVARNHFTVNGDPGALVNVAGVGILKSSRSAPAANRFAEYLLSTPGQTYFAQRTFEYPLVGDVATTAELPPLSRIQSPDIDLSDLATLEPTLALLREVKLL